MTEEEHIIKLNELTDEINYIRLTQSHKLSGEGYYCLYYAMAYCTEFEKNMKYGDYNSSKGFIDKTKREVI